MNARALSGLDLALSPEGTGSTSASAGAPDTSAMISRAEAPGAPPPGERRAAAWPDRLRGSSAQERSGSPSQNSPFEAIALQPRGERIPLTRWLSEGIRAAILDGRLPPGSRLPSRMQLARHYRVARGTVIAAVGQLVKQGYLDSTAGSGTYIRAVGPDAFAQSCEPRAQALARVPRRALSVRGRRLAAQTFPNAWCDRSVDTFRFDRPALDAFPLDTWNELAARRLSGGTRRLLEHGEPLGYRPLREAIAAYVADSRGVRCAAEQVVVTSGTQQSLDLAARLLLDPGDRVWMEDPGYAPATALLRAHGAQVAGVPVDAQGLDCETGRERAGLARLAYVTPACQFPLGVALSQARRLNLLRWAGETGAWIFEDDYDSQLQFGDRPPPPPLYASDRAGSVIYSSSFNRMLFPALRLGFLVLPPAFVQPAAAALSITHRYHSPLDQALLADFIEQGHLELHARRMRELYTARRDVLVTAATAELDGLMQLSEAQPAGLQVTGWLAPGLTESETWRRAVAHRINSVALSSLLVERRMPPALVLGVGSADERTLRTAIKRLRRVLRGVLLSAGPLCR